MSETLDMPIGALAAWFGGKRTMAPRIVQQIGKHTSYWGLCSGSMAVEFAKPPCRDETVVDLHGDVTNLARVVASDQWWELCERVERTPFCETLFEEAKTRLLLNEPDELQRAYDYLIVSWMGMNGVAGTKQVNANFCVRYTSNGGCPAKRWRSMGESMPAWHQRINNFKILRRDIFVVLKRIEDKAGTVIYIDPPYFKKSAEYLHDFDGESKHRELADLLKRFKHTRVIVSYYEHPIISELYQGWTFDRVKASKGLVQSGMRDESGATDAPELLIINGESYAKEEK